jgi:hypothetical protein
VPRAWTLPADFFSTAGKPPPRLTAAAVARAEKRHGVKLPAAYLELLAVRNGGYISYNQFPSAAVKKRKLRGSDVPVRGIAGVGGPGPYELTRMTASMAGWGVDTDRFLALDGEGHYWICLDKRSTGEPSVAYVASEDGAAGEIESCTIARTFAAFLRGLEQEVY